MVFPSLLNGPLIILVDWNPNQYLTPFHHPHCYHLVESTTIFTGIEWFLLPGLPGSSLSSIRSHHSVLNTVITVIVKMEVESCLPHWLPQSPRIKTHLSSERPLQFGPCYCIDFLLCSCSLLQSHGRLANRYSPLLGPFSCCYLCLEWSSQIVTWCSPDISLTSFRLWFTYHLREAYLDHLI